MTKIVIENNKVCQVLTEETDLIRQLRQHLSYKAIGVEFTPAYKRGWNGITYLVDKMGNFPIGLIDRVKSYLTDCEIKYEIEDKRAKFKFDPPIDISKRLKELKKEPRDYQLAILEATKKYDRGIVRATTGAGKSLAISICVAEHTCTTVILVIGLSLLDQFHQTLSSIFKEKIGYIGNSICDIKRINVCSIWTAAKCLDLKDVIIDDEINDDLKETFNQNHKLDILNLLKKTKLVVLDECHSVNTFSIISLFKVLDPQKCYGFSATPFRDDGSDLTAHAYLGEKIIDITASELIERGILAKPIIKFVDVPPMSTQVKTYQQVYSEYVVENDTRNYLILEEAKKLVNKKYKVLVVFKNIKHGNALAKLFKENKLRFKLLSGKDPIEIRLEVQQQIENDEIDIILGSKIMNVGIDIPILSGLILAGGGKSSIMVRQILGRVLRSYPNKKFAAVVDFYDNIRYLKQHSKIRHNIYKSEPGFQVLPNKNFKD